MASCANRVGLDELVLLSFLMTLYEYLKKQLQRSDPHPAIDHEIRAELHEDGRISFYLHARGRDSDTTDLWISDAGIFVKTLPMPAKADFLSHPKEWRDAKMAAMADKLVEGGYLATDEENDPVSRTAGQTGENKR